MENKEYYISKSGTLTNEKEGAIYKFILCPIHETWDEIEFSLNQKPFDADDAKVWAEYLEQVNE